MAGLFYKGILLQQRKEPALSRDLREFLNADTMGLRMDCPAVENPDELTYGEIINYARLAGIVDERDGEFLADKIMRARRRNVRLVIVDAIDDEPYISSQLNPVLKNLSLSATGLSLCQKACGATQAYFAVYKNLTDLDIRIPRHIGDYGVVRLHGRYPAEYQASQDYARDEDVFVVGSGAILHLARAVLFRKPQTTAFITVAGDCVGNPTNLEVSLGMTVTQTLERCGLIDDPHRVVVGGSMTGISVIDTDRTLVTPTTRAILAFRQDLKTLGLSCIGCNRCVHVCPKGLNPFLLYHSIGRKRYDVFQELDAQMCVGCGTCSYMCPAKLDLSETIFQAARSFQPVIKEVRGAKALEQDRREGDYRRYYQDYLLGKAIWAHWGVRVKLAWRLWKTCRDAMRARRAAEKEAEQALRQARQEQAASLKAAESALVQAKQAMDSVISQVDKEVADKNTELVKVQAGARRMVLQAVLLRNTSWAAARQNALACVAELRRVSGKDSAGLEKKEAWVDHLSVLASDHAKLGYRYAVGLCQERISQAEEALEQAKHAAHHQKEQARKTYEEAQAAFALAKQEGQRVFEAARDLVTEKRREAVEVYRNAAKEIRPQALETLREADEKLIQAREEALLAAREAACKDAAQVKRDMRPADFRTPIHLSYCERELLKGRRMLAVEDAWRLDDQDALETARLLAAQWAGEAPPVRVAIQEKTVQEVVS